MVVAVKLGIFVPGLKTTWFRRSHKLHKPNVNTVCHLIWLERCITEEVQLDLNQSINGRLKELRQH
jgi:preprotein translocase subunit Sec63